MKAYVLPRAANRALHRLLFGFYVRSEFSHLTHRLALYLRCTKIQKSDNAHKLMLLVNRIYLTNVYRYIELGTTSWFLESLHNAQFGNEINVETPLVFDLIAENSGLSVVHPDRAEIENLVCRELMSFMAFIYSEQTAAFNEVLIGIFEMLNCHVPCVGIRIQRFEITPNLDPLLFYTENVSAKEKAYESLCTQ